MVNIIDPFIVWLGPYIVLGVILAFIVVAWRIVTS
jgi:hypothetical protein